jgi:hypothetical protein
VETMLRKRFQTARTILRNWKAGLDLAEISANLLEAAQLVPMHKLPSRQVILLREGQPNMPALRSILVYFTTLLTPNQLSAGDPRRSRPPGFIK